VGKAVALVVACFCIVSGCGLEDFVTSLRPPNNPSTLASETTPTFEINVPAGVKESQFRGYELYYKFYVNSSDIEISLTGVSESELRSTYKFRPVCSGDDSYIGTPPENLHTPKPQGLFAVPIPWLGSAFLITVTFSPSSVPNPQPTVSSTGPALSVSVRRNVPDTNPANYMKAKPFAPIGLLPAYQENDRDINVIWPQVKPIPDGGNGVMYLAMYALSYGVADDHVTDLYSTPVYLGYTVMYTNQ
jgi:hypothetical protein